MEMQSRFELILFKLLRNKDSPFFLRNGIEDLLLRDYGWKEDTFGFSVSIDGLRKLIEEIRQLLHLVVWQSPQV